MDKSRLKKTFLSGTATGSLVTIAMLGFIAGTTVSCKSSADATAEVASAEKHACKGMNACKGHGNCASGAFRRRRQRWRWRVRH